MSPARPGSELLVDILAEARDAGFLGPGPIEPHIAHAEGFGAAAEQGLGRAPENFADLGTGGGIPGFVLAIRWQAARGVFIESGQRRAAWLRDASARLAIEGRIEVLEQRAESSAHRPDLRECFDVVTARSFADPAVTAEIAAGLVRVAGVLVVS